MGIFNIIRNTNDGLEYMDNALNYALYGHTDYDKRYSLNTNIDNAYEQFLLVKRYSVKQVEIPYFTLLWCTAQSLLGAIITNEQSV